MQATVGSGKSPKKWKKRAIVTIAALSLLYVLSALLISTLLDQRAPLWQVSEGNHQPEKTTSGDTLRIATWNLMQARGPREAYNGSESNLPVSGQDEAGAWLGILNTLTGIVQAHDLVLLQEVGGEEEEPSSQIASLRRTFPKSQIQAVSNHVNDWLPWPFSRERSMATGMALLQIGNPDSLPSAQGPFRFPIGAAWPASLWKEASYCSVHALRQPAGLVIIHLSMAPVRDTVGLREAFAAVREMALREYESGGHVIIGGDWGMAPPNFRQEMVSLGGQLPEGLQAMPGEMMPVDWLLFFDPMRPSMRSLAVPYNEHGSQKTTTDFFICSPNVRVLGIEVLDQQFQYTNHQPVSLQLILE